MKNLALATVLALGMRDPSHLPVLIDGYDRKVRIGPGRRTLYTIWRRYNRNSYAPALFPKLDTDIVPRDRQQTATTPKKDREAAFSAMSPVARQVTLLKLSIQHEKQVRRGKPTIKAMKRELHRIAGRRK